MVERSLDFDINQRDRYGRTALMWAAEMNHREAAETLIDLGADRRAADPLTSRCAGPRPQMWQQGGYRRVWVHTGMQKPGFHAAKNSKAACRLPSGRDIAACWTWCRSKSVWAATARPEHPAWWPVQMRQVVTVVQHQDQPGKTWSLS